MRYWVYQDSRILGPFNKEDLHSVEGLHQASLVCPDGQSGTKELDWVPLEHIEDLSSVFGPAAETARQAAFAVGGFDQFSHEAHASLEKIGSTENWMESIQKDPRLSDLWGGMPEDLGQEKNWQLHQNADLESRFSELQAKLDAQEHRQNEILDRLGEKDRQLAEKDKTIEQLRSQLEGGGFAGPLADASLTGPAREAPPAPEMVPFGDDLDVAPPVSRHAPVESGDAVSGEPLLEPSAADMDGPLILDDPEIPDVLAAPPEAIAPVVEEVVSAPELDAMPSLEEPVLDSAGMDVPVLDGPVLETPVLEGSAGPVLDAVPGLEEFPVLDDSLPGAALESSPLDEFGIPEATPLKSVSEMPEAEGFVPPTPDDAGDFALPGAMGAGAVGLGAAMAMGADAPPLEAPPLDDGGDFPPMPVFDAPPAMEEGLAPPPLEEAFGAVDGDAPPLMVPGATPETIDLSAPVGLAVPAEEALPPAGDDPFAAPKTMMMGNAPTPAPSDGPFLNLTPPPMSVSADGGGDLVGGMPPGMEGPPGSTPMPIPLGEGASSMMGTPPPTPMPSMGQPDLPQTVMQGLGVSGMPTPMPMQYPTPSPGASGTGFQDMMGGAGAPTPLPIIPGAQMEEGGSLSTMMPMAPTPAPMPMGQTDSPLEAPSAADAPKQSTADKLKAKMGKLGGKKFLIGLVIAVLVLAGLLFMFLRNPKDVVKMAEMGPEQKTQGSFDVDPDAMGPDLGAPPPSDGGGQKSSPFDQAPQQAAPQMPVQAAPQAPPQPLQEAAPPVRQPEPAPAPAAPPRRAFIQDQRIEAMEFVKGFRISGGKEVVAQRLQYYFLGNDNLPEWQAGALEKNKWIVEYHVFKGRGGGQRKKPTVTYRFEVDLAAKTVKGLNARARTLLGGAGSRKRISSRTGSSSSRQAPLPSEDQLDGSPSGQSGGFNNPGE